MDNKAIINTITKKQYMKRKRSINFVIRLWAGLIIILAYQVVITQSFAQNISITTSGTPPNPSALLDIDASPTNNMGLLIPRVPLTITTSNAPIGAGIATSLLVYNTATINNVTPGYYYWDGSAWVRFATGSGSGNAWLIMGNAGTLDGTNFLGTTDNVALSFRVNNQKAGRIDQTGPTFFGYQAGNVNTAISNVGIGYQSLFTNTTGVQNTALGYQALAGNTTGWENTAIGYRSLQSNTTGLFNTALGDRTLQYNLTGMSNTAIGGDALINTTTGGDNTAVGLQAMMNNTTGNYNTAIGEWALYSNVAGRYSTAVGSKAMYYTNSTAAFFTNSNVALGYEALRGSTTASANTGNYNTALGYQTLWSTSTGWANTATGYSALYTNTTGISNTAFGYNALNLNTTGSNNTALGSQSLWLNTTGIANTATGINALRSNTTGYYNTASGQGGLYTNSTGFQNIATGVEALMNNNNGSNNVALGYRSGYGAVGVNFNQCTFVGCNSFPTVARTNVTMLGYNITNAECTANNQVLLGSTAVTQLRAAITGITAYSDARFKTNIKENVTGLDFILKLKPVTYNVRPTELHKIWGTPDSLVSKMDFSEAEKETRIGFLAQDVEKAAKESGFNFPGIDVPRNEKEVYTLRYVDFIMPMVKAVQELNDSLKLENAKQQTTNGKLQTELSSQQKLIEEMQKEIDALKKK
jgi:hypothetical protein